MDTGGTRGGAASPREWWLLAHRPINATPEQLYEADEPLRTGVERGMVATVAVAGPLLVLLSLPAFAAERTSVPELAALSLLLVVLLCLFVPLALLRAGAPTRGWLLLSVAAYCGLIALERPQLTTPMPTTTTPWLVSISCVAISCWVISTRHAAVRAAGSVLLIAGITSVYTGLVPAGRLVVDGVGLTALTAALTIGARALRRRADRADAARLAAQRSFIRSRRQIALDAERSRTDALLHDSVLSALLAAAGGHDVPQRTLASAQHALELVSDPCDRPEARCLVLPFERVVAAMEREFAPMQGRVRLDLAAARDVQLPIVVAETIVSATLQALTNSIRHAGPSADRSAVASPTADDGLRITIRDDGRGFDPARIAPERLGVRVSIIERMRQIGGTAQVLSRPGEGTVVVLEWSPNRVEPAQEARDAVSA